MSYDIYLIKKKNLQIEEVDEYLTSDVTEADDHYISKELMKKIKLKLENEGLEFEVSEDEDSMEFNFPSFQVSLYISQAAISLPYWDENKTDKVGNIVEKIIKTFEGFDMKAYDPQAELIYDDDFYFMDAFSVTQDFVIDKLIDSKLQKKWWQFWK